MLVKRLVINSTRGDGKWRTPRLYSITVSFGTAGMKRPYVEVIQGWIEFKEEREIYIYIKDRVVSSSTPRLICGVVLL